MQTQIALSWQDVLTILNIMVGVVIIPLVISVWKQNKEINETHLKALKEGMTDIKKSLEDKVNRTEFNLVKGTTEKDIEEIKNDMEDVWGRCNKHGHLVTKDASGNCIVGKVVVEQ